MGWDSAGASRGACRACAAGKCAEYELPARGDFCDSCGCRPSAHARLDGATSAAPPAGGAAPAAQAPARPPALAQEPAQTKAGRLPPIRTSPKPHSPKPSVLSPLDAARTFSSGRQSSSASRPRLSSGSDPKSPKSPKSPTHPPAGRQGRRGSTQAEKISARNKLMLQDRRRASVQAAASAAEDDDDEMSTSSGTPASAKSGFRSLMSSRNLSIGRNSNTSPKAKPKAPVDETPEEQAQRAAAHLAARDGTTSGLDEEPKKFHPIIKPDHPLKLGWDLMMMMLVIYYGLSVPVRMAFITSSSVDAFTYYFDYIANAIFVFDICMNFVTAVRVRGALVTDYRVIAHEYLRLWFWIDVIASVPIDMFIPNQGGSLQINKLLRLLRIFKLFRVFRMARILKRLEQFTKFNPAVLRLLKIFFSLSLTWHWMACTYWLSASLEDFAQNDFFEREDGANQWVPPPELWCDRPSQSPSCLDLECFDTGECPASLNMRYVSSFFWAIMVTTGIGRDIMPVTYVEHTLSIILIITGVLMGAVIIGSASSALSNLDAGNAEKRQKLEAIQVYMRQRRVPTDLQRRIREYYEYMWSSHQSLDGDGILGDLHASLRLELQVALNRRLIENVPLFAMVTDEDCLIDMIEKLTSLIFIPGEYILLEGELGAEMYVVVRGLVQVLKGPERKEVAVLKDGDVFGEQALITRQPRNASVRALTYCDFLVLQKSDFDAVMFRYPEYFRSLQREVVRKYTSGWDRVRTVLKMARNVRMLGFTPDVRDLLLGGAPPEEEAPQHTQRKTMPLKRLTMIGRGGGGGGGGGLPGGGPRKTMA